MLEMMTTSARITLSEQITPSIRASKTKNVPSSFVIKKELADGAETGRPSEEVVAADADAPLKAKKRKATGVNLFVKKVRFLNFCACS
jgi:hypothetical protein